MQHTGQGQIIQADAITQDENGNWVPATPEPYHPFLIDKIKCFFGYHSWHFSLKNELINGMNTLVIPDMIPDDAECLACNKKYA